MAPKVSIILPVFNTAQYVKPCIRTILRQDFTNFELLIVDDGSTDGSTEICASMAESDPRVTFIRAHHEGYATVRNHALRQAKGQYITFVDSDDYLHSAHLAVLVRALDQNSEADVAVVQCKRVSEGWQGNLDYPLTEGDTKRWTPETMLRGIFYNTKNGYHFAALWNKMYRREVLEGLLFEPANHEDTLFNTRVTVRMRQAVELPATTYLWQRRRSSATAQPRDMRYFNDLLDLYHCLQAIPAHEKRLRSYVLRVIYHFIPHCRQVTKEPSLLAYFNDRARSIIDETLREMLFCRHLSLFERAKMLLWLHCQWAYDQSKH